MPSPYIGRFAPSPTGPLHFGSLIAATASYLCARQQGGLWLLRMEDLDPPREQPGAADQILRTLEAYGFQWDGPVVYQSQRSDLYEQALASLKQSNDSFECSCTRKQIIAAGGIYPGTCRAGPTTKRSAKAIRINTQGSHIEFDDALQGQQQENLEKAAGDFILRRADGLYAYQLAVVVDDWQQGITEVVRGKDLLGSTPRQIFLQKKLGYNTPHYLHLPIVCNEQGKKLSKQTHAPALSAQFASAELFQALVFLGQNPPTELTNAPLVDIWQWATKNWTLESVPRNAD